MFTTDSRTENFLTALGVKYEYLNGVRLPDDFREGWNTENIGRPVAVREDAVIEYATLMESGSAAPAVILVKTDEGYRVLDGVQRLSAAELQQTTRISAYVVTTDSEDALASIRVLANARMQGRAEPAEWARRRAVEVLVIDRKMSPAEVARMGGWKPADIKRIAEAIEIQERISIAGGPEFSDAMLAELSPHLQASSVIDQASVPVVGFLQTLKQSRMSAADAAPFIATFFAALPKSANPHKTFSDRLEEIHEDPEIRSRITGRQSVELPKDVVLLKTLKSAETVLDHALTHGERVPNIDEFFRILDRITKKLKEIAPNKPPVSVRVPADMWSKKS
jgi:ParB-like chromosome segregation protein Spo0J